MADKLRDSGGGKGLVTGNGWYLTKHSASVWSTEAGSGDLRRGLLEDLPSRELDTKARPVTDDVSGSASVLAYTVQYDREGAPSRGIFVGDTASRGRCYASRLGA